MFRFFWIILFINTTAFGQNLQISVRPIGLSDQQVQLMKESVLQSPIVEEFLRNKVFRVLDFEVEDEEEKTPQYHLVLSIGSGGRVFEISGPSNRSHVPVIQEIVDEVPASTDEFAEAVEILKADPEIGPEIEKQKIKPYEPMPTTSLVLNVDRSESFRLINVGIMSDDQPKWNEIVSVDLHRKKIIRYPQRAPPGAVAVEKTCGPPNANQRPPPKGRQGSAEIEIRKANQVLWKFKVVRPAASSGRKGSGLELRNVFYKGQKVLNRAHTPILNVQYEGDKCGPFRDWTYSESAFEAHGYEKAPGILMAAHPPQTIFDTLEDRGSFQGVAIYQDVDRTLLITELSAGWYRYVSKFELYHDGKIKPSFEFSSVENSCVCFSHNHHVYWRFDFDVGGTKNSVQVSNGQTFLPVESEVAQVKNSSAQGWRILNAQSGMGYDLIPGPNDGAADTFSLGDVWLLRHSSREVDDENVRTSTQAGLQNFVSNQKLTDQDLVLWYSGHFIHSHDKAEAAPSIVGPTLVPVAWPRTDSSTAH